MDTVNGIPAHILLVHAVVVLLPLAAFLLVLTAAWPAARRRLAGPNVILSVVAVVLVPLTSDAGEWLQERVASSALVESHVELGETAIIVAIPVALLAFVVWWRGREIASVDTAEAGIVSGHHAVRVGASSVGTPVAADPRPAVARRTWLAPKSAAVGMLITVLSVAAAGATVYDIYRIGDSGAQATWQGRVSTAPAP